MAIHAARPELKHDFRTIRRLALQEVFREAGADDAQSAEIIEGSLDVYMTARQPGGAVSGSAGVPRAAIRAVPHRVAFQRQCVSRADRARSPVSRHHCGAHPRREQARARALSPRLPRARLCAGGSGAPRRRYRARRARRTRGGAARGLDQPRESLVAGRGRARHRHRSSRGVRALGLAKHSIAAWFEYSSYRGQAETHRDQNRRRQREAGPPQACRCLALLPSPSRRWQTSDSPRLSRRPAARRSPLRHQNPTRAGPSGLPPARPRS